MTDENDDAEKLLDEIKNDVRIVRVNTDMFVFAIRRFILEQAFIRQIVRQSATKLDNHEKLRKLLVEAETFSKLLTSGVEKLKRKYKREESE